MLASPATPPSPSPTHILVVDDDPLIRESYDEILRAHGYHVVTAGSRAAALQQLARCAGAIDVLILDIGLPDASGAELAHEISNIIGARPTLYVSGWADEFCDLSTAPAGWLVMQKPIPIPRLLEAAEYLARRRTLPAGEASA